MRHMRTLTLVPPIVSLLAVAFTLPLSAREYVLRLPVTAAQAEAENDLVLASAQPWGWAEVTYDSDSNSLSYFITYEGLTGTLNAAHFHGPAEWGEPAGVLVPISDLSSPMEGTATLTEYQEMLLLTGRMYVNLHTTVNPGGEIRGQTIDPGRFLTWSIPLTPDQEVPAPDLGSSSPTGRAFVILDTQFNTLVWQINYEDLTGPATAAHFHGPAVAGQTAPPIIPLTSTEDGAWNRQIISDEQEGMLMLDLRYLNIHTAMNPSGEIRGNIVHDPTAPSYGRTLSTWEEPGTVEIGQSMPNGYYIAHYDMESRTLHYWLEWAGTTGAVTAAHFHGPAEIRQAAGILVPITDIESPSIGSAELTEEQEQILLRGMMYVNLHTSVNPGGELRSQVYPRTWDAAYAYEGDGRGYYSSDWFGPFWGGSLPWVYSYMLGSWAWTVSPSPENMNLWVPDAGWIWTSSFAFPMYYSYEDEEWLMFDIAE